MSQSNAIHVSTTVTYSVRKDGIEEGMLKSIKHTGQQMAIIDRVEGMIPISKSDYSHQTAVAKLEQAGYEVVKVDTKKQFIYE